MKRIQIFCFGILPMFTLLWLPTTGTAQDERRGDELKSGVYFNPLGVLQFGPMAGVELGLASNTHLDAHWRYSALGLIYRAVASDGFEDEVSFSSMAVGGGVKQFLQSGDSRNRYYVGASAEYGWGGTRGNVGTQDEWEGKSAHVVFFGNFGHRWRFPSSFFLNLGLMGGVAKETKDDWWYLDSPSRIIPAEKETYFFGMVEFSLGWEL